MVFAKTLADLKIMRTFAPAIERESVGRETIKIIGALVQLVRIHACHAWGHGFESRTHRIKVLRFILQDFFVSPEMNHSRIFPDLPAGSRLRNTSHPF